MNQCKQLQNVHCGMPMYNCSECRPTILLQVCALTVLSVHRLCALWTLVVSIIHVYECNLCSFDTHCRSHQKMWLHIRRRLVVPGNMRRSSRMSHRVWQLWHYLVDYKWWILLKPEQQSYTLSTEGSGREGDGKANISEAFPLHEMKSNKSQC